jgi:serine/threonine-protein kinase
VSRDSLERRREALNVVRNLAETGRAGLDRSAIGSALVEYLQSDCEEDFVHYLFERRMLDATTATEVRNNTATFEPAQAPLLGATLRDIGLVTPMHELSVDEHAPTLPDATRQYDGGSLKIVGRENVLFSQGTLAERVRRLSDEATMTATGHAIKRAAGNDRYEARGLLGLGGMGEVYEVADVDLNRAVALKRVRADRHDDETLARFLLEAQVTAQLEHPHIVPVHDFGKLEEGQPFFTMKRVEGRTLRDVVRRLAIGEEAALREYSVTRLMILYLHVVEAVAYAHARGVVHCDLKPENILLGRHGEVLVSDWGMATLLGRTGQPNEPPVVVTAGVYTGPSAGGTLLYMAPEQMTGQPLDERTDIYALGAILYELLTLTAPYELRDPGELLVTMFATQPEPPSRRAPRRDVPPELEELALRALQPRAADRYATADEVVRAVEGYLTGERKRETALERHSEGEAARARYEALKAERAALEDKRDRLRAEVRPYDGEVKKAPLWRAEERLYEIEVAAEEALAEALDNYSQAVGVADLSRAADRLADLHVELFLAAESAGDRRQMHFHRRQIERHHRGRHTGVLSGRGSVTIAPRDDLIIEGYRLVEKGLRIVPGERVVESERRLEDLSLPMGSYLFTLRAPGYLTARVPVLVGRGSQTKLTPRLLRKADVPPGFVHVPAGPFLYGGDKDALNAGPRTALDLDEFLIAQTAVTCAQYCEFLNALAHDNPHVAEKHVPRTKPEGGYLWSADARGRYEVPTHDADGNPGHPDAPVMGVSHHDAVAYANWRADVDGFPYRLLREEEWEKAARGADGRFFPWGNGFDATFCKMATSRPGRPQPEPVGSFPVDTSVFGVKDCAGAIREWCADWYDDGQETRVLRGGAWYFNPAYCRVCFRHGYMPHIVFTNFGIRLGMSLS